MVYFYGRDFAEKIGWTPKNVESQSGFWTSAIMVLWIMLFGGNYAVIRDGISLLPICLATKVFVLMMIVTQKSIQLGYIEKIRFGKTKWVLLLALLLMAVFSGMPNIWGILLQISAVLCGIIVGCRLKNNINSVPVLDFILGVLLVLILMQPEFFRFGQLGNLTVVHLLSLLVVGFFCVTAIITKYVNAREKINAGAYIKIKWFLRIVAFLLFALFVLTESVPVFVWLMGLFGLLEFVTIRHRSTSANNLSSIAFSLFLIGMGIITICPVISAIGIVYMLFIPGKFKLKDFLSLL